MVKKCCVLGCRSESVKNCGISFFAVPKNESLLQLWKDVVPGRLVKHSVVCHLHFKKEDIMTLSAKPKLRLDAVPSIFNTDAQPNTPRSELTVPTICISKGPERYLEIPPLTKALMKRPKVMVVSQNTNPLYLENEPMNTINQDQKSDHNLSIKSESISIKSEGFEEDFIDDEEIELEDSEEETSSKKPKRNTEIDDVEENYLEEDDDFDVDEKDECKDYDETINASDTSEDDDFEEAPLPIPATITVSKTNKQDEESQKRSTDILRKKILALHKQLKLKDNKLKQLQSQMSVVKNYTRCSEIENILRGNYRKLCVAINKNGVPVNYSDDVIKFAISVNYYSPKAYEFIRKYMSLPNTRMLEKYASTGTYIINLDD